MNKITKDNECSCCQGTCKNPFEELETTFEKYQDIPGSLISILQSAQEIYGFLSVDLMRYVAMRTEDSLAKIYGVATFYTQFRFEPVGEYLIMLCQGTACHVNGSAMIEESIIEQLNIKEGETTPDGLFTLNNVACLGCCSLSPVMMINDDTYGQLTPKKIEKIIKEIKKNHLQEVKS